MTDVPGDRSTTATITVGGSVTGVLETRGDHDWFRIDLVAGQNVVISLAGFGNTPVTDTFLRVRDANGNQLAFNDDSGGRLNSQLAFTASVSGTYYLDAGAFNDQYTGGYQLSVRPFTPQPLWSFSQIADQLTSGYWDGNTRSFGVTQGATILVNITGLTADGQFFARNALNLWSDITGIRFFEVSSGGQIIFDDAREGAFAESSVSFGRITSSRINIGTEWIAGDGRNLNTYSFQTYLHEIGHALGLGHPGDYNEDASYPDDVLFRNDSWAVSVMSYFDQQENSHFRDQGFTFNYVLTPQIADILAISSLYGLSTTTRTGDTTYGFGSNAGRSVFDANQFPTGAYTIFDSGGIDTLNYSGFSDNQVINLDPGSYSNVGNNVGNVSIALGTIIENAIGGSGNDQLTGNDAGNRLEGGGGHDFLNGRAGDDVLLGGSGGDVLNGGSGSDLLTGGDGSDLFSGTRAELNGDTITDFDSGDRIVFSDASLGSFTFALSGNSLTFSGGSLNISGGVNGRLIAGAASTGGTELRIAREVRNDFNGDGRSDILWRHSGGDFAQWLGQANGGLVHSGQAANPADANWRIVGTGDFNGDGRSDILWRHTGGSLGQWLGQANGSFLNNSGAVTNVIDTSWTMIGTGDFNGDGRHDLIWQHSSGEFASWLGQANGGFVHSGQAANPVDLSWRVATTGDFNGDGRDDILWRHSSGAFGQWLGGADGRFINNGSPSTSSASAYQVAGTGDFNGDGRADLLLRNAGGEIIEWLGQANGGLLPNAAATRPLDPLWRISQIGDFNGDGRDDLLFRHGSGELAQWLGQPDGSFGSNSINVPRLDFGWAVQAPEFSLV
jgi:Ca2+-binding RTX toxin-like protein